MPMLIRYSIGLVLGLIVTVALFLLMQALIRTDGSGVSDSIKGKIVDFVRVDQDPDVQLKSRKPKPPLPPDAPPPRAPRPSFEGGQSIQGVEIGHVDAKVDVNIQSTGGFTTDGQFMPIVKVAPMYPRSALLRAIEGYVVLEFTVTATGAVRDPVVIEAQPEGIFERAAVDAALRFKYKPKVVDGVPVEVPGVRHVITFKLEDE